MKLATFAANGDDTPRLGVLSKNENSLIDLFAEYQSAYNAEFAPFSSMQAFIEGGVEASTRAEELLSSSSSEQIDLSNVNLLAPLPQPIQFRDCMCFEGHLLGCNEVARLMNAGELPERSASMHRVFKERPIYYKANRFAVCGPDTQVQWPSYSRMMDYELEMACVLSKGGRNISKSAAKEHIFGFTIFNDLSARDTQRAEMESGLGPSKSKDFDNANVLGPWIVTADEFNPYSAKMTARVNGEIRSEGFSSEMTYRFEDLIEFISKDETLHSGEVLGSGTVGGGCGLEQGKLLQSGDLVELTIDGIGSLRTRVRT